MREPLKPQLRDLRGLPGVRAFLAERLELDPATQLWDVVADVTRGCNLSCAMCLTNDLTPKALATPDVVQRIQTEVLPHASDLAIGCRAEPLLHPDLPEILAGLRAAIAQQEAKPFLIILTSGTLLTAPLAARLADCGLDMVLFSIETTDPNTYAQLRRGGTWPVTRAGIEHLRTAPTARRPKLGVQTLPSRQTLTQLPKLMADLAEMGVGVVHLPQLIPDHPGDVANALSLQGAAAETTRVALAGVVAAGRARGLEVGAPEPLQAPVTDDLYPLLADNGFWDEAVAVRDRPAVCIAPWSRVRIDHEGNVYPCHRTLSTGDAWGNLKSASFLSLVNSDRAIAMRRALLAGRAPNGSCRRCPFGPRG